MPSPNEQDGKYRRRPAASSSSSSPNGSIDSGNDSSNDYYFADPAVGMGAHRAVAAAEAAVSSILSDAPLATFSSPKGALNLRGRANAVSGAHSGTSSFYMNNNNDTKAETGAKTLQNASLVTKLKQLLWKFFNMIISRGPTTQQPYRREKSAMLFGLKKREILSVIILLFAMGIFFLGGHVHKDAQHSTMRGAYHAIVSIPPPPRHEKHYSATTGSLKNDWEKSNHVTHEKSTTRHNDEIHINNPDQLPKSSATESIEPNIDNHSPDKTKIPQPPNHHHAIPPILIFTYHTNLLTTPHSQLKDAEDIALSKNIQQIVSLHPHTTTRFLNDADCLQSIRNTLGNDTKLTVYFTNESHGMYKADICRGAALYETGGLYFDIDIEARMSLWDVIDRDTEFVTTLVHKDSHHLGGFFQAFIGVTAGHPVMKRYLELFVDYYEGRVSVNGPLGVYFLRMAYDELLAGDNDTGDGKLKNVDRHRVELWQEIKYKNELFPDVKKPPGKRRACQMLVVAPEKEFPDGWKRERMVPFYSHATGSRMCGGHDTKL